MEGAASAAEPEHGVFAAAQPAPSLLRFAANCGVLQINTFVLCMWYLTAPKNESFPIMSLHAVALSSYSRTDIFKHPCSEKLNHESLKVAFTESACSSNPSARISCLAPTPQISILSDESSRPAVIGHAGSFGSYPNSAEAIKDILMSVLNASGLKPSLVLEQNTMQGAEHPDSDMEQWEESSAGDSHDDSDSDSVHRNTVCTQTDIRFTRHRACWNNTHSDSSKPLVDTFFCPRFSDGDPAASCLSSFTLSDMSPLKQDCFTQVTLTGGTVTSAVVHSGKECYTFPERDLTSTRFLSNSTVGKPADLVQYPDTLEPVPVSNNDSSSPRGLPQSEPVNPTGSTSPLNISAIPLNRSLQDICMLPEDVEKVFQKGNNVSVYKVGTRTKVIFFQSPGDQISSLRYCRNFVDISLCLHNAVEGREGEYSGHLVVYNIVEKQENAHFFVADMIIASLEKMKCNILSQQAESWGMEETSGSDSSYHTDSELYSYPGVKKSDSSVASSDSGYEGKFLSLECCALLPVSSPVHLPSHHEVTKFGCHSDSEDEYVIIELEDLENLSVTPDKRSPFEPGSNSAEATAQELCRAFRKYWLQRDSVVQLSGCLSSSKQRSVLKEEIPKELESSLNLAEEIKIISKLRGSSGWSPPRSQIIFNIHPSVKRDVVVAAQNFTCVGCGTPIESKYIRRLRYCDYLGKYFCDCCHSYAQSCIPARILSKWDFKKYYVCNFSKHLLDSIWQHPIFNVLCINKTLYTKSKEMDRVREAQEQLFHLKKLLKTCRFGESVLKEYEQVPSHLTEELHLFSLDDLVKIKRGQLLPLLKDILKSSISHVDGCEVSNTFRGRDKRRYLFTTHPYFQLDLTASEA
ncbi:RUN and cysteine rich domain containing beclin 1 interacting protein like protein [Pitangus sulphuratus]|nr:RUN and cysteine rich domain containing beclin 1 interacting protein like protein [Pitangus sulphuratus]